MSTRGRILLIIALVFLGVFEWWWTIHRWMPHSVPAAQASAISGISVGHPLHRLPPRRAQVFTTDEVHAFLVGVRNADAMADPLQRCLNYPDPPHSHWSPATVKAYCQYYLHPVMSFDEAKVLIEGGKAAELDQKLSQVLQAQRTLPDAHGLLDHTYFRAFDDGSFDVRPTLDAWKRASPNSAFAYAASGMAYVAMAQKARGGAYIQDTPQSNIDAMDRLLSQADADLQRAVTLDPQVTPAYVAMINAGSLSLGDVYVRRAVARGLAAAADNYAIYGVLSGAMQPRWGGSLAAMDQVAHAAQAHVNQNPLLAIVLSAEPAYRYDVCNCQSSANWSAFPTVFDNVSSTSLLSNAGYAASENAQSDIATVYLSEVLRFQPGAEVDRRRRDTSLLGVDESKMALDDANRLVAAEPEFGANYRLRGNVYASMMDNAHAEQDLEHALALNPDSIDTLSALGNLYTNHTQEWDKAWDIAERIIRKYPGSPGGWAMKATIQENHPGADLRATYQYFVDNFSNDPNMQWHTNRLREALAKSAPSVPANPAPAIR